MTAALVSVASGVEAGLAEANNLGRVSQPLNVVRGYVPRFDGVTQVANQWNVYVSSQKEQTERIDRKSLLAMYLIDVGVSVKLADRDVATIDSAMNVLEQIADYFFNHELTNGAATWMSNEVIAWPDREGLAKSSVLFALWTSTFQGVRSKS